MRREDREKIEHFVSQSLARAVERRLHKRRAADITINYSIKAEAVTKNITHEGLCLVTHGELPVGKIIYVVINIPGCDPVNIYGRVVWSKEVRHGSFENGIEYWEIRSDDEEKLIEFFNGSVD
jgi:hypothetical protein